MKIVIIGGSGFIGSKLVKELRKLDHIVIAASSGAANNSNAGKLGALLRDAQVVIDVSNAPSSDDKEIIEFFQTSGHNLMAAEMIAGVKHHITFSLVGIENLQDNGFFKAKKMQETLVKDSEIPYTILQATQFYELVRGVAQSATIDDEIRISNAKVQPVASDDVTAVITDISVGKPLNITVQIAGPERFSLNELV
ncbi:MAG TPA: SDR family oxidoreductase, partial [Cyclobacteriaceae bacterium]|nr:SDR family oxidoreductase [Cyclobacteriaceae bacterium]